MLVAQDQLKFAAELLGAWKVQNDADDGKSNFIYRARSVGEVQRLAREKGVDYQYALHRWYNFHTSKHAEHLFAKYGATPDEDVTNHDVDLHIPVVVPVDIKVCKIPEQFKGANMQLMRVRRELIKWLYENASTEGRQHFGNKVFVVCDDEATKCDFNQIEQKVIQFMGYAKWNGLESVTVKADGCNRDVRAGLIYIKK